MKFRTVIAFIVGVSVFTDPLPAQSPELQQRRHATPLAQAPTAERPHLSAALPGAPTGVQLNFSNWTALGPAPLNGGISFSGRITGIAAHPTLPNTIYIAAAGGGVWMTSDGGGSWTPLTDDQLTLSMGAIAISQSNPSVIYAGTGEANNSIDSNFGRGILVSTDAGASWSLRTGPGDVFDRMTTAAIAVDPTNEKIAYAAMSRGSNGVLGVPGIYKTTDGGVTWINTTASVTSTTRYSDVKIDPNTPTTLYGAVGFFAGASVNGVYKSTDGGSTWTLLTGAPKGLFAGRITIAIGKANSQVVYVAAHSPITDGIYKIMRSDDAGATFTDLTGQTPNFVGTQGWYDLWLAVDPANSAIVYAGGSAGTSSVLRSTTSGVNWSDIHRGRQPNFVSPHPDHHGVAFDANGLLLDGNDGGIFRLDNPTVPSWSDLNGNLSTIQYQGIGLHPTDPNKAIGGSQDNGTSVYSGSVVWSETDGSDGGFAKFSPTLGTRAYHVGPVESFGPASFFRRSDDGGITWTSKTSGFVDSDAVNFYPPFVIDPNNGDRLLLGGDRVYETTNAADNWTAISVPGSSGWTSTFAVDAIGLAKSDVNTIYAAAGTSLFVTTNRGATWTDHPIGVSGIVADIQVDPTDPQTAYAVLSVFSSRGTIFKTINGGGTWSNITGNLPNIPVWSLQIDPGGTLYIGAENGVYSSTNGGTIWNRFHDGLPHAQVFQIELNSSLGILAAGTHGRGVWEIALPPEPIVGITLTHAGAFAPGQTGVFTVSVENKGNAESSGVVSVSANLPAELLPVSIAGSGWACTQPSGPCARSDALAAGSSYPPLNLTVAVAASATAPLTTQVRVTVDGGASAIAGESISLCTYAISPSGQAFAAAGGTGTVAVTTAAGCGWGVTNQIPWISIPASGSGSGSGSFTFQVAEVSGPARAATFTVAGLPFHVEQQAAAIPGLSFRGSMPHIAAEEDWTTTFTFVSTAAASAQVRLNMLDDGGSALPLSVEFPQQASNSSLLAASLDRTLPHDATLVVKTTEQRTAALQVGSAQLSATAAVGGYAIFSFLPTKQEAVVPLETRNASSYLLAFDNMNGVVLGVSLENVSALRGNVAVVIRDDTGAQIGSGNIPLSGSGHKSFVLSSEYPVTANQRGTIEFDTPFGGQISVLGVRFTPPGMLTTVPVLANVGTAGGSISHLASAKGWKTTFVLVNAGSSAAQAHLKFFDDNGSPLSLPLAFPQSGAGASSATALDRTLAAGAMLLVESTGPDSSPLLTGSAQLTTDGNVGGFVIFRYTNGQEAVVQLENRTPSAYLLAFDNTAGIVTGVAVANATAQSATVPVVIRDETGVQMGAGSVDLAPNGHSSFLLADKFRATANIRGTVEFGAPESGRISVLGVRTPPTLTFTTLPALTK